jgi:hypothetical protein
MGSQSHTDGPVMTPARVRFSSDHIGSRSLVAIRTAAIFSTIQSAFKHTPHGTQKTTKQNKTNAITNANETASVGLYRMHVSGSDVSSRLSAKSDPFSTDDELRNLQSRFFCGDLKTNAEVRQWRT